MNRKLQQGFSQWRRYVHDTTVSSLRHHVTISLTAAQEELEAMKAEAAASAELQRTLSHHSLMEAQQQAQQARQESEAVKAAALELKQR